MPGETVIRQKHDIYVLISVVLFAILVAATVAISMVLAVRVDNTQDSLRAHEASMMPGEDAGVSDQTSIASVFKEIRDLQTITYGIVAGVLVLFCATLMAGMWIDRQRARQKSLIDARDLSERAERQRSREFEALCNISGTLAGNEALETKTTRFAEELAQVAAADWVTLRLNGEGDQDHRLIVLGSGYSNTSPAALVGDNGQLAETALREARRIVVSDYSIDPMAIPDIVALGVNSVIIIPISIREGTLGIVSVFSKEIDHFTQIRVKLLTDIVNGVGPLLEIAMLEEQRKEMEKHLKETARLASIGELAAGVAHEVNNPLTNVLGYSQMLLDANPPESMKKDLQIVVSESLRAAKIIRNLQLFARKSGPQMARVDVNTMLEKALELKVHEFETSGIKLTRQFAPEIPDSMMDEDQLIQVVVNLLNNAQQAIESMGKKGQVTIRSGFTDGEIRFSIIDDGPGIPAHHMERIFEPFFTTKEVGLGTGLGLSICHGIVRQHDGLLWVESVVGEGASFHVKLPLKVVEDQPDASKYRKPEANIIQRVLAVDDEPEILNLLRRYLELDSYSVDLAGDGAEAWELVQKESYDCILLDLMMPGINGRDLYYLIKDLDETIARKVIFITGDTVAPDTQAFVSSTENLFINKPFQLQSLREQMGELLANSAAG